VMASRHLNPPDPLLTVAHVPFRELQLSFLIHQRLARVLWPSRRRVSGPDTLIRPIFNRYVRDFCEGKVKARE
jgi:hypothetical protein